MWDGIDRRRFPRAQYPCRLTIWVSGVPESLMTQTDNIGVGGVALTISAELTRFAPVDLEIDLNDGQPALACQGRVIWVVKKIDPLHKPSVWYDTGIEFVSPDDDAQQRLKTCLQKHTSRS